MKFKFKVATLKGLILARTNFGELSGLVEFLFQFQVSDVVIRQN